MWSPATPIHPPRSASRRDRRVSAGSRRSVALTRPGQEATPSTRGATAPAWPHRRWSSPPRPPGPGVSPAMRVLVPAPTPYESGLAAVARREVHIERVWPMRSPPTGSLEESSSAYFQRDRRGTPPASIVPVGGLQMSQAFEHQPVMTTEVVDLFGPVPPGLIVDATVGGGGHARAILEAHPALTLLGIDRDPTGRGGGHRGAGPVRRKGGHPSVPLRRPGPGGRPRTTGNRVSPTSPKA